MTTCERVYDVRDTSVGSCRPAPTFKIIRQSFAVVRRSLQVHNLGNSVLRRQSRNIRYTGYQLYSGAPLRINKQDQGCPEARAQSTGKVYRQAAMTTEAKKPNRSEVDDSIPADQLRRESTMSNDTIDNEMPWLEFRWMHGGAQYMDLPTAPITSQTLNYVPFSTSENVRLEEAYQKLSEEEKLEVGKVSGKGVDKDSEKSSEQTTEKAKEKTKDSGNGDTTKVKEESSGHVKIAKANGEVEEQIGDALGPDDLDVEKYPDPGNEVPSTWKDQKAKEDKDKQDEDLDKVVGVTVSQVRSRVHRQPKHEKY